MTSAVRASGLGRVVLAQLRGLALGLSLFPAQGLGQSAPEFAVTPAALAPGRAEARDRTRSMSLLASAGPEIRVAAPSGFTLSAPVDFDIRIEARDNVPVSMQTLRIDYRIGPVWADVTDRIIRHGRISGTRLQASGADLPKGRHKVRISVSDAENRTTVAIVEFAVH